MSKTSSLHNENTIQKKITTSSKNSKNSNDTSGLYIARFDSETIIDKSKSHDEGYFGDYLIGETKYRS